MKARLDLRAICRQTERDLARKRTRARRCTDEVANINFPVLSQCDHAPEGSGKVVGTSFQVHSEDAPPSAPCRTLLQ